MLLPMRSFSVMAAPTISRPITLADAATGPWGGIWTFATAEAGRPGSLGELQSGD
jgi:hypothetical protein